MVFHYSQRGLITSGGGPDARVAIAAVAALAAVGMDADARAADCRVFADVAGKYVPKAENHEDRRSHYGLGRSQTQYHHAQLR